VGRAARPGTTLKDLSNAPLATPYYNHSGPYLCSLPAPTKASSVALMPSLEHNGFVDMFRENPSLAPHFLAMLFHLDVPPYASVTVVESALD
jgi:hypothetical protein